MELYQKNKRLSLVTMIIAFLFYSFLCSKIFFSITYISKIRTYMMSIFLQMNKIEKERIIN